MRIIEEQKLDFDDVLIIPKRSRLDSRREVDLVRSFNFLYSKRPWNGIPIMAANMDTTGTIEMVDVLLQHNMSVALHKHYTLEELIGFFKIHTEEQLSHVFYSMGITNQDYDKFKEVYNIIGENKLQRVCLDVANGYSEIFSNFVKKFREAYPELTIMAGNVVTKEMVEALILAGADIVKIGIGPGSVCTTREVTGVGYPQFSATIECADAAHGMRAHICTDGGLKKPGDFSKAFGAGADFVMSGNMFAGHDESGGNFREIDGEQYKEYYGMSSDVAMDRYNGGMAGYRASEGKRVLVKCKGPVASTVQQILGGLRSACTYVGADKLKDLSKCATFIKVRRTHNTVHGNE